MTFAKPLFTCLAVLLAGPGLAAAQSRSAPPLPPRVGFELGFGLYAGEINCDDENGENRCDGVTEAGGVDLHANYFFSPGLGLFADVWPMVHSEENWSFTHNILSFGVKVRPSPIITLAGGIGSAQARVRYDDGIFAGESETDVVPAIFVSAGVDVFRGPNFALDLEARLGVGFYDNDNDASQPDITGRNIGVGAGLTWF